MFRQTKYHSYMHIFIGHHRSSHVVTCRYMSSHNRQMSSLSHIATCRHLSHIATCRHLALHVVTCHISPHVITYRHMSSRQLKWRYVGTGAVYFVYRVLYIEFKRVVSIFLSTADALYLQPRSRNEAQRKVFFYGMHLFSWYTQPF